MVKKRANIWSAVAFGTASLFLHVTASAQAAEVTFFEYQGFSGRSLTLRGHTPNFGDIGFNDKAASAVVRSGTWQVCTDAEFRGTCATLTRGEYRQLDGRFANNISSAREIAANASSTGAYSNFRRGSIELFEGTNFQGQSVLVDRDANNFGVTGFNDRAGSAIVHDGVWDLCTDSEYRGACRTFTQGRYADLGPGMARQISSARMAGGYAEAPYVLGGSGVSGYGTTSAPVIGGQPGSANRTITQSSAAPSGRLILYDNEGFTGRSMAVTENVVDLQNTGFNDQTVSILIESGRWELCTDAYFRGQCVVMGPGQHRRLDASYTRAISSIRWTDAAAGPRWGGGRGRTGTANRVDVELFEHDDYQGRKLVVNGDIVDFQQQNFNDITSSLVIYSGQWEVCTDAQFAGRCVVYGPGQYPKMFGLNDQFSSIRRVGR
jgi:hypothetical protein